MWRLCEIAEEGELITAILADASSAFAKAEAVSGRRRYQQWLAAASAGGAGRVHAYARGREAWAPNAVVQEGVPTAGPVGQLGADRELWASIWAGEKRPND